MLNLLQLSTSALALMVGQDLPSGPAQQTDQVEEVVVTAQRREQRLQDVPIVVTVLNAETLQNAGVRDIKDLTQLTPGLIVTSTVSEAFTTARIRGVGTVGDNPGLESSVGVMIDGVYRPRNGVGFGDLGELERIEILKGPQGTLFGKNTSAGLISVVTRAPQFTPEAGFEATLGNYGALGGSAFVTGPLGSDALAGRLFVAARQRDGFLDVRTGNGPRTSTQSSDQDYQTVRGQLLAHLGSRIDARVIGDYTTRDEDCCLGVALNRAPSASLVDASAGASVTAPTPDPFARIAYANRESQQSVTDQGISLEVNVAQGLFGGDLTSVTAVRTWEASQSQDPEFSAADILYRPEDQAYSNRFETFTQELRLAGSSGRVDWLVGALYTDERLERVDRLYFGRDLERYGSLLLSNGASSTFVAALTGRPVGTSFTPGQGMADDYQQDAESIAVFTHNDWRVTDAVTLTLGLRFTHEEKTAAAQFDNTDDARACTGARARFGAGVWNQLGLTAAQQQQALGFLCVGFWNSGFDNLNVTQTRSDDEWSGTLKAAWRPNENLMTYASFSRGYKAGGFNLDRTQTGLTPDLTTSFPGEFVDSWELGAKSDLFSGRLLLNGALFYQEYEDFQLNTFLGTTYVVRSVPEVVSKGLDLDALYRAPIDGLTVQGGFTYAETRYGDDPVAGLPNLPGRQISFAPLWSASAAFTYERPIARLLGTASLSLKHNSSYNTGSDLGAAKEQGAFSVLNGRLALGSQNRSWSVEAFGQNLLDEDYIQVAYDAAFQPGYVLAFLGAPRTFGLTVRGRF